VLAGEDLTPGVLIGERGLVERIGYGYDTHDSPPHIDGQSRKVTPAVGAGGIAIAPGTPVFDDGRSCDLKPLSAFPGAADSISSPAGAYVHDAAVGGAVRRDQ